MDKTAPQLAGHFLCENDIVIIQETWNTKDKCVELKGYHSFHFVREYMNPLAQRGSGGISVLV